MSDDSEAFQMRKRSWSARGILTSFAFLSLCSVTNAQFQVLTNSTSTPTPGVPRSFINLLDETVDPANGTLSLRIQIPTPPGRRLTLPFSVTYDSNSAHTLTLQQPLQHLTVWTTSTRGGWSHTMPLVTYNVVPEINNSPPPHNGTCDYSTGYIFKDTGGGQHPLKVTWVPSTGPCYGYHTYSGGDDFYGAWVSGSDVLVSDADGTIYSFLATSGNTCCVNIAYVQQVEDRNGNILKMSYLTNTGPGFSITDTLGRSALSVSSFGNSTDTITVPQFGNNFTLTWGTVTSNFAVPSEQVINSNTCPAIPGVSNASASTITSISLPNPNSQPYQFQYDQTYGVINKIIYPSGGYVSYVWGPDPGTNPYSADIHFNNASSQPCFFNYNKPVILHRYVSFDGQTTAFQQDFSYSTFWVGGTSTLWSTRQTTVTNTDLISGVVEKVTYTYTPVTLNTPPYDPAPRYDYQLPVEQTEVYQNASGTTVRTVNKSWYDQNELKSSQTVLDNGQSSQVTYTYGSGAVVTQKNEYDFGASTVSRQTVTNYQSFGTTPIVDKPCQIIVYDASGTRVAETDFLYDGGTTVCGTSGSAATTAVSNLPAGTHDETNYASNSTTPRGNATTVSRLCLQSCTNAVTTYSYDETGQTLTMVDPCANNACADMPGVTNHTTTYSYADNYDSNPSSNTNAHLTQITDPLGHTSKFKYAYSDGQLIQSQDQNDINASRNGTTYSYNDPLRRLSGVTYPDGGSTTVAYNDSSYNPSTPSPSITTSKIASPSPTLTSLVAFDGMGHQVRNVLTSDTECASGDRTDTSYVGTGQIYKVSNPYCSTSDPTYGLTTYSYDSLGRTISVTSADGTTSTTSYVGSYSTVTDSLGIARKFYTDGLGRMTNVWEDPNGLNYATSYSYDGLDNLTTVTQNSSRNRSFNYDSLSRLLCASSPENSSAACPTTAISTYTTGTTGYSYDANGNLSSKTSLAPNQTGSATVTTTYTYDALNRLTYKSYSDGTTAAGFYYDQSTSWGPITNGIGRLTTMATGTANTPTATGAEFSYDPMGRTVLYAQCDPSNCGTGDYEVRYSYDVAGNMTSIAWNANPLLTISYAYSGAGRVTTVTSSYIDSQHPATLATLDPSIGYFPNGAIRKMTLGNSLTQTLAFNSRLQQCRTNVNSSGTALGTCTDAVPSGNILDLATSFQFGTQQNPENNGDVGSWTAVGQQTFGRGYSYDSLNRLYSYSDSSSTQTCKGMQWIYDAWGNMTNQNNTNGNCPSFQTTGANTKNQLNGAGSITYQYDAAGNMTYDGAHTYYYDAENRLIQVDGTFGNCSSAWMCYVYDANGIRVRATPKTGGGSEWIRDLQGNVVSQEIIGFGWGRGYIYLGSQQIAEYGDGTTYFIHPDHLGSTRAMTKMDQSVCQSIDYLPFGQQTILTNTCGTNHLFTGKENDAETSFDYLGARYYGSQFLRFTSPDPENRSGYDNPADPQGWNAYSYVRNNPLNLTDPDGRDYYVCIDNGNGEQNCVTYHNDAEFEQAAKASGVTLQDGNLYTAVNGEQVQIGTAQHFGGPSNEGTLDVTADYFFNLPALLSGVKAIFNLGRAAGAFELTTIGSGTRLAGTAAVRQALNASGGVIDRIVQTSAGPVRVYAVVTAEGETAVIKELAVYPVTDKDAILNVGYTGMRQGFRQVLSELKEAGYSDFRMEPQYRSGGQGASGGANPFGYTGTLTGKL